jgi:hypothetical protein
VAVRMILKCILYRTECGSVDCMQLADDKYNGGLCGCSNELSECIKGGNLLAS